MNRDQRAELARRLGARFRQLHDDEGWTQDALAEESGVPLRTVSDTLREVSVPNLITLEKLAGAMGVALDAAEERESWPDDIKLYHDTTGLILSPQPEGIRRLLTHASIKAMIAELERLRPAAVDKAREVVEPNGPNA